MVNLTDSSELQLNKANSSDIESPFLDLHLTISDDFVSSKIYDKRVDFDFDTVTILRWDCSSCCILRGLYISAYWVC